MFEIACRCLCTLLIAQMAIACDGPLAPAADTGPELDASPDAADSPGGDAGAMEPPADAAPLPRDPGELVEDPAVYDRDDLEVHTVRLTVTDQDGLDAVHADEPGATVDVLFQAGDFAMGVTRPNGTMRLRGATARLAKQKSYRIKLFSKTDLWRGHRVIHLNKHPYELSRVRQKLSFEYFKEIRHFTSLRTSFVRLFLNGEDMGFYTQIERPAAHFLFTHGLDPEGQLYKAERFTFREIPEEVWQDPEALERYLEPKANPDHDKLREMLAAVRDEERDFDEVLDTYFHRDNFLTWWAVNLLMGNYDTISQNYLLYSPSDSLRWYFLPWDYDDTWGFDEQPGHEPHPRYMTGVGNWWFVTLHQRFLRDPGNVAALARMVDHLADEVITPDRTAALLDQYRGIVRKHISVLPDIAYLPTPGGYTPEDKLASFELEYARIPDLSERYREELFTSLEWPMPVWMSCTQVADEQVSFRWTESFDLQGDAITYDLQVSTSPTFEEGTMVEQRLGLEERRGVIDLPAGTYFARVLVRDQVNPDEHWQHCANMFYFPDHDRYYKGAIHVVVE